MLKIEHLCKTYKTGVEALRDISITVEEGEFVVVLGKSGSGKSTLLRCINRLVEPTSGRVLLNDEEITGASSGKLRQLRQKIGMVFQQYNLVSRFSVQTNVLAGRLATVSTAASMLNLFPQADVEKSQQVLDRLGIADKEFDRADKLSGGQQQRVGLARALMQDPQLILADEPTGNLDPDIAIEILKLFEELNQKGSTIIFATHSQEILKAGNHRVISLNHGKVVNS